MVTLHWVEDSPWGFQLEFLCLVDGVGAGKRLADDAAAMRGPTKEARLPNRHPLQAVAVSHPGELLWRMLEPGTYNPSPDPQDPPWQVGADSARAVRQADVERFETIQDAARLRRAHRKN